MASLVLLLLPELSPVIGNFRCKGEDAPGNYVIGIIAIHLRIFRSLHTEKVAAAAAAGELDKYIMLRLLELNGKWAAGGDDDQRRAHSMTCISYVQLHKPAIQPVSTRALSD